MGNTQSDALLVTESDHFLPGAGPRAAANAFSPVYEYLDLPLADLGLPFHYTLNSPQRCPPAVLAGYLRGKGFSCAIADNIFRDPEQAERFERLLCASPAVVGISTSSLHKTESVAAIAEKVRRLAPTAVLALGGCGPHFNPGMAAYADVVVSGDGELALGELVRAVKAGARSSDLGRYLPGAAKADDGPFYLAGGRDMALEHLPAWDLYSGRGSACYPVEASKGCAHSCVFCSYPERGHQDYRPIDLVLKEIRFLAGDMGARYLRFVDTNLTSDPAYIEELCRRLIRERLTLPWSCFARADELAARPDICALMAEAGCFWVYAGAESADPGILDRMGKGFGPESIAAGIRNVKAAGMAFHGNFVVGFPGETAATVERAYEMIAASGMDTVSFTVLGLTGPMAELSGRAPEKFNRLTRRDAHWEHSTMDFGAARRAASELIRRLALKDGAPLIVSHGVAMYYLLGGGAEFSEALAYFSAVRDYHRAKASGGATGRSGGIIRGIYEKTAVNFGWRACAPGTAHT